MNHDEQSLLEHLLTRQAALEQELNLVKSRLSALEKGPRTTPPAVPSVAVSAGAPPPASPGTRTLREAPPGPRPQAAAEPPRETLAIRIPVPPPIAPPAAFLAREQTQSPPPSPPPEPDASLAPPVPVPAAPPWSPAPVLEPAPATPLPQTPASLEPAAIEPAGPPVAPSPTVSLEPTVPPVACSVAPPSPPPITAVAPTPATVRRSCPSCGVLLEVPAFEAGGTVACPECGGEVNLAETLPASAAGSGLPAAEPLASPALPEAPEGREASFELILGTYWLARVGIVMVLTSLAFLGSYAFAKFGAGGRLGLLYLASGILLGIGTWLRRESQKPAVRNYGEVLFAGGLAAVYFTTYAAHYLPTLRVINSQVVDGLLLLGLAGWMVWLADRRKSEVMTLLAVGLAYYTSFITNVGLFTLYSNLVLTLVAVFFLVRHRWAMVSYGSLLATYAGFAFWRFYHNGGWLWDWRAEEVWKGNAFLACYWVLYTVAGFYSRSERLAGGGRAAWFTLNNVAFFSLVCLSMLPFSRGRFWQFALGYGAVLLALAAAARRWLAENRPARNAFLIQGLLLVTVGFISRLTGLNLALVLGAESVLLVMAAGPLENLLLGAGGLITAGLAFGWGVINLPDAPSGAVVGAALGAMMLFNAFWSQRQTSVRLAPLAWSPVFYTALTLGTWLVTTWNHLPDPWRALGLAVETVVLLFASGWLKNRTLVYGAYVYAALAVGGQCYLLRPSDSQGLALGAAVGGLMLAGAVRARWLAGRAEGGDTAAEIVYFTLLAQLMWLATTWTAGAEWRPLLFAAESVTFLFLGRQLGNAVLEYGAYLSATLGVALGCYGLAPLDSAGLWRGSLIGALMLLNAFEHRLRSEGMSAQARGVQESVFCLLAMLMWATTTWQNTTPVWRALALAVETTLLLVAGQWFRAQALALGAYGFAGLAIGFGLYRLGSQFGSPLDQRTGWWQQALVGALMLFNALRENRAAATRSEGAISPPPLVFTLMALAMWFLTTCVFVPASSLGAVLGLEALGFTVAYYGLALSELTLFGQGFLVAAQLHVLYYLLERPATLPIWNPVVVLVLTVGLSHWWQHQRRLVCSLATRWFWPSWYALATVGLLFFLLEPRFSPPAWLAMTSLLALAVADYGAGTRAWPLVATSQLLLWVSVLDFWRLLHLSGSAPQPAWYYAATPILALFFFGGPFWRWLDARFTGGSEGRESLRAASMTYRGVGVVLALVWTFDYVPREHQFWALTLLGGACFVLSGWQRRPEPLMIGGLFTAMGWLTFWLRVDQPDLIAWPNLAALLLILAQQQVARRRADRFPVPEPVHITTMLLGACTLWFYCSRFVVSKTGGFTFYLTASWAALALAVFCGGFLLRERVYRWHGLAVLTCALGRVFLFDVWKLGTFYRILSFLALGVVLLVLGFIYNKYQDTLRRWL